MSPTLRPEPPRASALVLQALALIVAVGVGAITLDGGFLFDDKDAILDNPLVQGSVPAWEAPMRGWWGARIRDGINVYRPITPLIYRLLWSLQPGSPLPFRMLALLGHLLTVLALLWATRAAGLPREPAAATALIFAAHATGAQAVGINVGSADSLSTALGVTCFGLACRARPWAAAAVLLLACGVKEGAFVFAAPAALALYWQRDAPAAAGAALRRMLPVVAVLVAVVVLQLSLSRNDQHWSTSLAYAAHGSDRVLLGLALIGRTLSLCALPVGLAPFHGYPSLELTLAGLAPHAVVGLLGALSLTLGLVVALRQRKLLTAAPLLLLGGTCALLSSLFTRIATDLPERLMYPSLIASSGAMVWLIFRLRRPALRHGALAAVTLGMLVLGYPARRAYHDVHALWQHAAEVEPRDIRIQLNRAVSLDSRGQRDAALVHRAIAAYYYNAFPGAVDMDRVHALSALPAPQGWRAAPAVFWPDRPCRFVMGFLGSVRREAPNMEPHARAGYRASMPHCFARP